MRDNSDTVGVEHMPNTGTRGRRGQGHTEPLAGRKVRYPRRQ